VYALEADLFELYPYRGDLHVHTYNSDGKESPEFVAAHYRKNGFDFIAITDHGKYYPSKQAVDTFKDVDMGFRIHHGEEIHLPENGIHIVNFAGDFSINEWVADNPARYYNEVSDLEEHLVIPDGINRYQYTSGVWAFNKIREGGGLAILPHPHWIENNMYHIGDAMIWHLFKTKLFDAFELIGGQTLQENAMQIALYHEARAKGMQIPIVGNSDSHGVLNDGWFNVAKTIVLSRSSDKKDIISAIKDMRSVALEQYKYEAFPRIYGSYRITGYVMFLLENWFPLHDELCFEEGRLMREYILHPNDVRDDIERQKKRMDALFLKYLKSE
jgi:predicted metal-dependent phosphoesterase TrpH